MGNKALLILGIAILAGFFLNSCSHKKNETKEESKINNITVDQLKTKIKNNEDFILLDVRQPEEYNAGHIENSVLIPLGELERRRNELDKSKEIVVYCRSGNRSVSGSNILLKLGFKKISNLLGGFRAWRSSP